ncbi:unnamed protein product [Microthlaspi erraticum]|uniref:Uncharacterized protein n=1 Tax=Microthlaspi erraticum TaxID=1685480 RepID=A0A6D2ITD1_9BRAS|nr:unnamed protein product [Microthlaspi erraticum]
MTLEQKPAKGTSLTEALTVDRHASSAKFLRLVQTALSRTAPKPRSPAGRGTNVSRSARVSSVRLKSRPKSKTVRPNACHDPETKARGRPRHNRSRQCRARPCRASRAGKQSLAAAQPVSRTTADGAVRAGKLRPASGRRIHRPIFIRPTTAADHNPSGHDRSDRTRSGHDPIIRPIVPTDRPNAAVDPKPVLKPVSHIFMARLNPKPPLKT